MGTSTDTAAAYEACLRALVDFITLTQPERETMAVQLDTDVRVLAAAVANQFGIATEDVLAEANAQAGEKLQSVYTSRVNAIAVDAIMARNRDDVEGIAETHEAVSELAAEVNLPEDKVRNDVDAAMEAIIS